MPEMYYHAVISKAMVTRANARATAHHFKQDEAHASALTKTARR